MSLGYSEKVHLRALLEGWRDALTEEARREGAEKLALVGSKILGALGFHMISGFCPFKSEIDIFPLMSALEKRGFQLCLPVVEEKSKPLIFRFWTFGAALTRDLCGMRVPVTSATVLLPDLILTPLLGFDKRGNRLGYGGGYYDRTIACLRKQGKKVFVVGVAFAGQEVASIPRGSHDEPLDAILTEEGYRVF